MSLAFARLLHSRLCLAAMLAVSLSPATLNATLLVKNGLFITMNAGQEKPFVGYMLVGDDGRISAIQPGEPGAALKADRTIDAAGKFVSPGFVSAHTHLSYSAFRGLGHTETLYPWGLANTRFFNLATAEDVYWFTLHGGLDLIRSGVTTAFDFTNAGTIGGAAVGVNEKVPPPVLKPGRFQEEQLRAKVDAGIRFVNAVPLPRLGTREEMIARFEQVLEHTKSTYGNNPLYLRTALSGGLQRFPTKDFAFLEAHVMKTYGVINQSHFLESPERIPEQREKFYWYVEAGALGPNFMFGHFIQTTPDILRLTAAAGATMVWNPSSNGRLASGVADIPAYRAFGIKVGVGLDALSCTDTSDPFYNLRVGLALIRTQYKDAKALSVYDMLYLHTVGSSEVIHEGTRIGTLEPGKFADFLIVDPRDPDTGPLHDPVATYVLACGLRNLKQVYIGGKLVADGMDLPGQDETMIRAEVDARIARIQAVLDSEKSKTAASDLPGAPHPFASRVTR